MQTTNDIAVRSRNIGLLDALDRVLGKGAVVDGDVYLCVAGIELVYLKLKLLLASTATVEKFSSGYCTQGPGSQLIDVYKEDAGDEGGQTFIKAQQVDQPSVTARVLGDNEPAPLFDKPESGKLNIDPEKVEQGLAKLVLTLVELLRKLMEKQALRRVEQGTLTNKEIDTLGEAFMRLDEKMKELKKFFGLSDGDLNLDLGPVGDLI